MSGRSGFSLVEVLVAVMVFAITGIIATSMLLASLRAQELNEAAAERIEQIDLARLILREDLGQMVQRPLRDAQGRDRGGALVAGRSGFSLGGSGQETRLLAFARAGRPNPGGLQPRGSLQAVEYTLRDNRLVRHSWSYPDRLSNTPESVAVILSDVTEVNLSYRYPQGWRDTPFQMSAQGDVPPLPSAIRLEVTHTLLGPLEFVVLTSEFEG